MSISGNYDKKHAGGCNWCVRAVKWIPVLFIIGIVFWSYYAYVVQLSFFTIQNIPQRVLYLLLYHGVFVMFFWSYWQTIFTDVAKVSSKFRLPRSEINRLSTAENEEGQKRILEAFARDLPVLNRTITGAIRYCDKCQHVKPDRAHHCSVCGTCVLKMDHHCPWINNCVNFSNYKYFILFLGYALLYCMFVGLSSLEFFVLFWRGELEGMGRFHILFLFFVSVMFAISLVSLFGYHCYLVVLNRTTLESFRAPIFRSTGPDKNGFSLGRAANFQEVFGEIKGKWLLPVFTSIGNGISYPIRCIEEEDTESLLADSRHNDFDTEAFSESGTFLDSRH